MGFYYYLVFWDLSSTPPTVHRGMIMHL